MHHLSNLMLSVVLGLSLAPLRLHAATDAPAAPVPEALAGAASAGKDSAATPTEATGSLSPYEDDSAVVAIAPVVEAGRPWSVNVGAGSSAGMILLHPTRYTRSSLATVVPSLSLSASYRLLDKVSVTGSWGASYELTPPNNPSGRRFFWSDPSFSISHASLYRDRRFTGLKVSGSVAVSLPFSLSSWTATQLFALNTSLTASRAFLANKLSGSLTFVFGLPFYRFTNPVVRTETRDGMWRCLTRVGGAEVVGSSHCAVGSQNAIATFGATLAAGYQLSDSLGVNASFGLMRTLRYAPPVDAFSSRITDSRGKPVVDGSRSYDLMIGGLSFSYVLGDGLTVTANLSTGGAPFAYYDPGLDDSNRALRFPFWDPNLMRSAFSIKVARSF